jgi:hypothetical protein
LTQSERFGVPELFPELCEESLDTTDGPSCSAAEALERQEPFVNQTLAQHALALLTRLFRYGRIDHHGAFINVAQNRVQPLAINPQTWKKMSRRGRRFLRNYGLPKTGADRATRFL